MEDKIKLDFFGEEIIVPIQKDLSSIRQTISSKFCFTNSDAEEIVLYYLKENKKIIIQSEDDYKIFLKEKTKKIFLDISQESKIYQKNLEELKKKEMNDELEKLYKKREELNNLKKNKFEKEINEIKEIEKEIRKMKLKMKKLKTYIYKEEQIIEKTQEENENKITELEKKLGIEGSHNQIYKPIKIKKYKNKKIKHSKKNKKAFIEDINKIVEEKKEELENYANAIKYNLSNSLTTTKNTNTNINTNKIILKSRNIYSKKLRAPAPQNDSSKILPTDHIFDYSCYVNRELSWINFNLRVLNEAKDPEIPILERIKFCAITSSNLDEFFMVRVAAIQDSLNTKQLVLDISGLNQMEQLQKIKSAVKDLITMQYATYNRSLHYELAKIGVELIDKYENLSETQKIYVDNYFEKNVSPVLTPIAVDMSSPFPLISNKTLNISMLLKRKKKENDNKYNNFGEFFFGNVEVPSILGRLIKIPNTAESKISFILLENIIKSNINKLFNNYEVIAVNTIRVMRNADMPLDERDMDTLLDQIEKGLENRQYGDVLRLEVDDEIDSRLLNIIKTNVEVKDEDIFRIQGPLDMTFLFGLYDLVPPEYSKYKFEPYTPQLNPRIDPKKDIFAEIAKKDIFLFHPYETFDPIVDFVRQGSEDPNVLAIKQTLYRVSSDSPITHALIKAAQNGKQVTILLELKARFDEENNVKWAKELEKVGCHVIYGLRGLKTHCKLTLVVRRENDKIKRYIHVGTGNYNDKTAKLYTDCGIFTCKEEFGEDAAAVFNMISTDYEPNNWNKLLLAPFWMKRKFMTLIDREAENAKRGKKAIIVAKMNALVDKMIIDRLLFASNAGVKIHLIIRGICCLQTGIPGISDNIKVESIVGTFLEHNRIYYFYNDGCDEYYIGSADWMPRNLDKRVEIITPVEDEDIREKLKHILDVYMADNRKAYYMQPDGSYKKLNASGKKLVNSQMQFCQEAIDAIKAVKKDD